MKKNSNDFSQVTSFLSSACIWNIICRALSPPCCFSLSRCFSSSSLPLQLPDLSSQFNARHFSSDSLHVLPFSLHPLIFLPPSFHPPLSISLTHSLSCSLTLHLLFFDLLGPSVLSLTARLERRKKSGNLLQGFEQGRRKSPSHTQETK